MNETADTSDETDLIRECNLRTTRAEYLWLREHAERRHRILLCGIHFGREARALTYGTTGIVVGCCDFQEPTEPEEAFCRFTQSLSNAILNCKLRLKIGKLHTLHDSELADQFDMFVLNQPYDSADEAARDIQRGIRLCQPAALICGTCYNNPATKEAVDKLLPFRQLFGNIWFGYL